MTSASAATPAPHPLPDLSHLGPSDFEKVYEPSDDTFLLVDVLAADADFLRSLSAGLCVEVGCGSGCVVTHLATLLPPRSAWLLGGDVNRDALQATAATAARNAASVQPVQMDLLTALRPGLVDVLVFNPPYVPTSDEELQSALQTADISAAWAGGPRGRLVLDRLLPRLGALLAAQPTPKSRPPMPKDSAPSASPDHLKRPGRFYAPRAPPGHLEGVPCLQERGSGRPKVEEAPISTGRLRAASSTCSACARTRRTRSRPRCARRALARRYWRSGERRTSGSS
jgi:release factor glutamine methyltransferase